MQLNSGLLIGRARYVHAVYSFARELQSTTGPRDDQALMLLAYKMDANNISLDFYSELFQSIATAHQDIEWRESGTGRVVEDPEKWTPDADSIVTPREHHPHHHGHGRGHASSSSSLKPNLFHNLHRSRPSSARKFPAILATNKITSSVPAALHFNGRGKGLGKHYFASGWWRRLGQSRKQFPAEARALKAKIEASYVRIAEDGRKVMWDELCGAIMPLDWLAED